jgi:hypothetical protein
MGTSWITQTFQSVGLEMAGPTPRHIEDGQQQTIPGRRAPARPVFQQPLRQWLQQKTRFTVLVFFIPCID